VEWNKSASMFLVNHTSTLQIRVKPRANFGRQARDFKVFLRYPNTTKFIKQQMFVAAITKQTELNFNYCPAIENKGVNQNLDFCFTYTSGGKTFWFGQSLLIDIYPEAMIKEKLIENINIKLENITADRASDVNLRILDGLKSTNETDPIEVLEKFKKSESWQHILLNSTVPLDSEIGLITIDIPSAPGHATTALTLKTADGQLIHLHTSEVTIGRNKSNDIMMRNLPGQNEITWPQQKLEERNSRVSGSHCRIKVPEGGVIITDLGSTNGTYIDGNRVRSERLVSEESVELSLAEPSLDPGNILLKAKTHKSSSKDISVASAFGMSNINKDACTGLALTRTDNVNESYLIINYSMPLCSVLKNCSPEWLIVRKENNFAITNGNVWTWLTAGSNIHQSLEINLEIIKHQQYLT